MNQALSKTVCGYRGVIGKGAVACVAMGAALALSAKAIAAPVTSPVAFSTVYIPNGFDSNDNVEFVGEGMFRNTCYRPGPTSVKVDQTAKTISIGPAAYQYSGLCLQVILPFERVVEVGILPAGDYKVLQRPGDEMLGSISVKQAKSEVPDDFVYAPISQAFFKQVGAVSQIYLTGDFPSDCWSIDHVQVTLQPKVIVLQPIVKIDTRPNCVEGKFPFNQVVTQDLVPQGRYLIHVRSLNGKAVNTLVDVKYETTLSRHQ